MGTSGVVRTSRQRERGTKGSRLPGPTVTVPIVPLAAISVPVIPAAAATVVQASYGASDDVGAAEAHGGPAQ